ncbi:T9SS type A sorting domain-containing protein [candidate division WOR-3 bacterium]|nr:T9SS type A sorting domain-containing protein [candidate division WOR-3 bacterium]
MSPLQAHYDSIGASVQVLVVDILESMSKTKWIQKTYNIYPPVLNDQPGTVWNLYRWDNYVPSNFVIQRDADQTLFYRAHTMSLSQMIYQIDQALAASVEEIPATIDHTTLKTSAITRNRVSIEYSLKNRSNIRLMVYDIAGKVIAELTEGVKGSGTYFTTWYPKNNGVYFIKLFTEKGTLTRKAIILK